MKEGSSLEVYLTTHDWLSAGVSHKENKGFRHAVKREGEVSFLNNERVGGDDEGPNRKSTGSLSRTVVRY